SPVGTYAFTLGSLSDSNYTLVLAANPPTFAVTPATLTIMPGAYHWICYARAMPTLASNANGSRNNGTYAALSGALGTSATSTSPVGTYTFNLGTLSAGNNYTLALDIYLPTFAVTPVWPTLKVSDASGPYTQKPFTATATVAGVNGVAG